MVLNKFSTQEKGMYVPHFQICKIFLSLFYHKFRKGNIFTEEITKELNSRNICGEFLAWHTLHTADCCALCHITEITDIYSHRKKFRQINYLVNS